METTKIEKDAFEWSVDYKPFDEDSRPDEYARHGFIKGANSIIEHIKMVADGIDNLRWNHEQKYLRYGKEIDYEKSIEYNTTFKHLNAIIEVHT